MDDPNQPDIVHGTIRVDINAIWMVQATIYVSGVVEQKLVQIINPKDDADQTFKVIWAEEVSIDMDSMVYRTVCRISSKPSINIVLRMKDGIGVEEETGDTEPLLVDS